MKEYTQFALAYNEISYIFSLKFGRWPFKNICIPTPTLEAFQH